MSEDKISELKGIIDKSNKICVFTGAGISCASGIPDFRSADGLYNQEGRGTYSPEQIISHSFFKNHTDIFYDFYKSKMLYPDANPNRAHIYFAELEKQGKDVSIVTQNIDGLHQLAGSTKVYELHGTVHRNYCTKCHRLYSLDYIVRSDGVPVCEDDGSVIKPDVVLYEEQLNENTINNSLKAIEQADTLIVTGTSLTVQPAASFIRYYGGNNLILLNKSSTPYDRMANLAINDDIVSIVDKLSKI